MSNPTNGVRGGPSKRPDQKKNLEFGSFNSQGSSRRNIEEPQSPIDILANSSGALQHLADIAHFIRSSSTTRAMQMVDDDYGADIARENTIRTLTETVASQAHAKSEETEKFRQDNKRLISELEKYEEETKKALDRLKKVEDQHALAEASRKKDSEQKLQEEKEKGKQAWKTKKAEIEGDCKKIVRELDERLSKLSAENVDLKQHCKEAEEKLEKKKIRHARAETSLENDNKKLTEELKQLKAQFPAEGEPIKY